MFYNFGQMDTGHIYDEENKPVNILEWFAMGLMVCLLLVALLIISVAIWWKERV